MCHLCEKNDIGTASFINADEVKHYRYGIQKVGDDVPFAKIINDHYAGEAVARRHLETTPPKGFAVRAIEMTIKGLCKERPRKIGQRLRYRISRKRFIAEGKDSAVYFNAHLGKRGPHDYHLHNYLMTSRVKTEKGLLHFMEGENFSICCMSHFLDRLKERLLKKGSRTISMDYIYTGFFSKPMEIYQKGKDHFVFFEEGIGVGAHYRTPSGYGIFILITFLEPHMVNDYKKSQMTRIGSFEPKLRSFYEKMLPRSINGGHRVF